jgi:hypothetical protein
MPYIDDDTGSHPVERPLIVVSQHICQVPDAQKLVDTLARFGPTIAYISEADQMVIVVIKP